MPVTLSLCLKPIRLALTHLQISVCEHLNSSQMCFNQLIGLFLMLICLMTNIRMNLVHAILYRIAKTVECGLNSMSAGFLANMDDPHFTKLCSQWNSFAEAVDSCSAREVSARAPLHTFSVFVLP